MSPADAGEWRRRAQTAMQAGRPEDARRVIAEALAGAPDDAAMHNSAGNLHMRRGDQERAERDFARALDLEPGNSEYAINQAIALSGLGRDREAIRLLESFEQEGRELARYCSVRANSERNAGRLGKAAHWYTRCLEIDPNHRRARHGRARVAIERGEAESVVLFDRALALNPGEADLWLGKAQALDVAGDVDGALSIAQELVRQAPQWLEALRFLAQLRVGRGEEDFAGHYRTACEKLPDNQDIPAAWCDLLGGHDLDREAMEVAAAARLRFPGNPRFAVSEANYAGITGDDERAEKIFASLDWDNPVRWLHEARHRIRLGNIGAAHDALDEVLAADRWNISGWALRGILWRLDRDERADWLLGDERLHRLMKLEADEVLLSRAKPVLDGLHDFSPFPLGQSLRGGTQTRGILFARREEPLQELHSAIERTLERYRASLPAKDVIHPLLRHRSSPWALAGSWSVRLSGGGDHHAAHIHPQGIVSSALYIEVPPDDGSGEKQGWLELGRPPPDLRLDLPPIATIKPEPGHLALFPSYLYHGTRPFDGSRRMTVAFDVVAEPEPGL